MAKLTLTDIENLTNETTAVSALSNNNDAIEAALENTLSRDGTSPNAMNADLDMNSNRIYNLPEPIDDQEPLRLGDITSGENQLGIATQEEAEAGTSNATLMTPLRVENRIDSQFEDTSTDNAIVRFDGTAGHTQNSGVTIDDSNGIHASGLALGSADTINWGDTFLRRDAADTLSMYQGGNAQTFNVYGTRTDASNYERLSLGYSSTTFQVLTQAQGTGTPRTLLVGGDTGSGIVFMSNGAQQWTIGTNGHLVCNTTNSNDIGTSSGNKPRNIYAANKIIADNDLVAGAASAITFGSTRTSIKAPSDGTLLLTNAAGNTFTTLQLGGATSSFPSIGRSTLTPTRLLVRLADASAFTDVGLAQVAFQGASSGETLLGASSAASGTLTLPATTDTLVGKATTDTFTNKTFDTAGTGNSLKINGTAVTDKTGTGNVVLATSPSLTTPNIGAATGTSVSVTGGLTSMNSTAAPSGGNASVFGLKFGSDGVGIYFGTNNPTFTAAKGSLYIRTNGSSSSTRLYIATDSSGGWTSVTTAT